MINFIKQNRKFLISVFLTIGMLSSLIDVVILTQRPQNLRSKASSSEVIFKSSTGEILPLNKDNIPVSGSLDVIVELNPQTVPLSYKITQNPLELPQIEPKQFTTSPLKLNYNFQNISNNLATLFVEFLYADGSTKEIVSLVEINSEENNIDYLTSQKGGYKLSYDKRLWDYQILSDEIFGQRAVLTLHNEYGFGRLDIIESESDQDLTILVNEIIKKSKATPVSSNSLQFAGKPSYSIQYREKILGIDTHFWQQIVKDDSKILILEKRVPDLGYSTIYVENLLQGLSLTSQNYQQVKGVSSTALDKQSDLTTVQLVDLIRPSIANIVYTYCLDIDNLKPQLSGLPKLKYQFCASGKGSGFIVNEQGVVATNGHVVKIYPEEALVTNLLQENGKTFANDLIRTIYLSDGKAPTETEIEDTYNQLKSNPQYINIFLEKIFELIEKKILTVSTNNERYYVNIGEDPIKIDYQKMQVGDYANAVIPSSTTYKAKLLDFDFPNKYSYEAIINKNYERGSDVALLQIENPGDNLFLALTLGNTQNLKVGSDIVIAGYPTLVEGEEDRRAAISYKTSTKPTITKGIVSAIKEDLTGKTVFQTDASIDHGNSGGPALDLSAEVIGIATFAVESKTGNYNFLRDSTELKSIMKENNINNDPGNATTSWRKGLSSFWHNRYNQAIKEFIKVEALNSSHPTIKEFIKTSQVAIDKGESVEGFRGLLASGQTANIALGVFGSISIISFMLAGFLTILPFFIRERVAVERLG